MRKLLFVLTVVALLLALVACGGEAETSKTETPTTDTESEATEVTTKIDNTSETVESVATEHPDTDDTNETVSSEADETLTETGTETDADSNTETDDGAETTDAAETDGETTEKAPDTEDKEDGIDPKDGAVITLANDEVYGWWADYKYIKTDSSPFYRHEDIYYPIPVIFTWEADENADYYRFYLSLNEDFSDSESYLLNENGIALEHLFVGSKYYWTVVSTKVVDGAEVNTYAVEPRSFTTVDSPRCLRIEGVSNTRDIGGLDAKNGKRIKQGMIYRGGKLEDITEEGKAYFLNILGLKTDLDLRTPGEGGAGSGSPLGADINYVNINGRYYVGGMGIQSEEGKKVFAEEIRLFADPDNYPIYIHCSLGRDRTGTLAFVIEALLGVTKLDLFMDYELSIFSVTGTLDNAGIDAIRSNISATYDYINDNYDGESFAEKTENYLLSIGITAEEIQTIRDLLLEEVK